MKRLIATTMILFAAACSSKGSNPESSTLATSQPPTSSSGAAVINACQDGMKNPPPISSNAGSLIVGPVSFVGARTLVGEPANRLQPPQGSGAFTGVFAVVSGSSPVTVSIDPVS